MPRGSIQAHYFPFFLRKYVFPRNWLVQTVMPIVGLRGKVCHTAQFMVWNGGTIRILGLFFGFLSHEFVRQCIVFVVFGVCHFYFKDYWHKLSTIIETTSCEPQRGCLARAPSCRFPCCIQYEIVSPGL